MADTNAPERGNKPAEYKTDFDQRLRAESAQVRRWRDRIDRAAALLHVASRTDMAAQAQTYLNGTAVIKGKPIYCQYLRPLVAERHRKTLPAIPAPRIEARRDSAEQFAQLARELIDLCMNSEWSGVQDAANEVQWDDDEAGAGFLKTEWQVQHEPNETQATPDENLAGLEVQRAESENADVLAAKVADTDIDYLHLAVHREGLDALAADPTWTPEYVALLAHVQQHEARLVTIKRERPTVRRIPWWKFAYDIDVPWRRRAWEAEERSVNIADMIEAGYKNVNPENCPTEDKQGQPADEAYADKTARVLDIHDRLNGKRYVIPAQGPRDGLFLWQEDWTYGGIDVYLPWISEPWRPEDGYGAAVLAAALPIVDRLAQVDASIDRHVENHSNYTLVGPLTDKIKSGLNNPNQRFVDASPEFKLGAMEVKPPPLPEAVLQQRANLLNELRRVFGLDAQDTGTANPHQITATESSRRSTVSDDRKAERQHLMGRLLAAVAKNFLALYKKFGTLQIMVRVLGPAGAAFQTVDPAAIPDELDVFLDIQGESEESKAQSILNWQAWIEFKKSVAAMLTTDWQKVDEAWGRRLGIQHPEDYRAPMGTGMQPAPAPAPGQPGMPGEQPPQQAPGMGRQPMSQGMAPQQPPMMGQ